ncbi:hypothetical protein [Nocardioides sp. WS12]|uniref:hypothetical protein n=1 Tax=Nocardioides sp. WS12 TaxID=2486272 RepID=UPI0015FD6F0E|nr:hypothetical protein [Nocardioides sp. WS12]
MSQIDLHLGKLHRNGPLSHRGCNSYGTAVVETSDQDRETVIKQDVRKKEED